MIDGADSLQALCPGAGDLGVMLGLDSRYADCADHLAVNNEWHAAFQLGQQWRRQKGVATPIDHVLITLGFTAAQG